MIRIFASCERAIKERLRDPSSYEYINRTLYGSSSGGKKRGVLI